MWEEKPSCIMASGRVGSWSGCTSISTSPRCTERDDDDDDDEEDEAEKVVARLTTAQQVIAR